MNNNIKFALASFAMLGVLAFSFALAGNATGSMMMGGSMSSTMMGGGESGGMMAVHQTVRPPMLQIGSNGKFLGRGMIVQSVTTTTFTATVWGITYTVVPAGDIKLFVKQGNSVASDIQFQAGDEVGVSGMVTSNNPLTVQASIIRDYSLLAPRLGPNEVMSAMPGMMMHGEGSMMGGMHGDMSAGTMIHGEGNGQNIQNQIQQLMQQVQMLQSQMNQGTTSQAMPSGH